MMESASLPPSVSHTDPVPNALAEAQKAVQHSPQGQTDVRNQQILQASLQVSIAAGNDGLALLYRTAVDEINRLLAPELGDNALQALAQSQDNSPEATAGRIVSMSTAMFHSYAARYPDQSLEEVAQRFVAVIRSGFEQGYAEAQKILHGLGVLDADGPVAQGIDATYGLVHQGLDDWLQRTLAADSTPASPAPSAP